MTNSDTSQDNATGQGTSQKSARNLLTRIAAAAVLVPLALGAAYAGGVIWIALVSLIAIGLFIEWLGVVGEARAVRVTVAGALLLAVSGALLALGLIDFAVIALAIGLILVAVLTSGHRGWAAAGFLYAAGAEIASVLVRLDIDHGWSALLLVLVVVWASDIGGYVVGRGIGGPKLSPRISPNKTWAGAIGGFAASLVVTAGVAADAGSKIIPLLVLGAVLSVASQLGDLLESAVKRHFGVKDSGHIIPGHGGILDRLDGYVAAIVLAAVLGLVRGGLDGVGRGLMIW